ncbi:hypothetical protein [Kytococcus sp. Marseille-QA3725]
MARQEIALVLTAAVVGLGSAQSAVAAPDSMFPAQDPLDITVELGEGKTGGERPWTVSVDGEFTQPEFSEDGLAIWDVRSSTSYDGWDGLDLLGAQHDTGKMATEDECTRTEELAPAPVTVTSDAESYTRDYSRDEATPVETLGVPADARMVTVETQTCMAPSKDKGFGPYLFSDATYLVTPDGELELIYRTTMEASGMEGSEVHYFPEPGWEWIEEYRSVDRHGSGMSDDEWADHMVAEGVLPADKRWYAANEEPPAGPIVDTGRVGTASDAPAVAETPQTGRPPGPRTHGCGAQVRVGGRG